MKVLKRYLLKYYLINQVNINIISALVIILKSKCITVTTFVERFSLGGNRLKVAVKDTIDVAGFCTRAGSRSLMNIKPSKKNAEVVDLLLSAKCHLIGKLNMHELAYGMTGINHWSGTPSNFLYPKYITGGSSSGSAVAVAEGSADFTLGTDTGGSIRVPATCCGVYGLKPTFGRISRKGVMPKESSLDCVGPLAANPQLLEEAMSIIDPRFATTCVHKKVKFGRLSVSVSNEIDTRISEALLALEIEYQDMTLPSMAQAFEAAMTLIDYEAWKAYGKYAGSGNLGEDVSARLLSAEKTSLEAVSSALDVQQKFSSDVDRLLKKVDVLLLPTLPHLPLTLEQALTGKTDLKISTLVRPFNLSGHPALTIPFRALTKNVPENDYPAGLQLIAGKGQDELLCAIARKWANE